MKHFVAKHSIVRTIWGRADTVLFIFAGAAAEFALNKAVDWLYFTGKVPQDPLGNARWIKPVLIAYLLLRRLKMEKPFRNALLPALYKKQVLELDQPS